VKHVDGSDYNEDTPSVDGSGRSAAVEVADSLREQIQRGERGIGEWLREQKLCDEFHVGRTVVRTALRNLAEDGLVTLEKNRGGYVSTTTLQEVFDLFELRAGLYGVAARFACIRGSTALVREIISKIEFMMADAERGQRADELIRQSEEIFSLMSSVASSDARRMIEAVRRKTRWHYSYIGLEESPRGAGPFDHWSNVRAALLSRDADKASSEARNIIYYIQTRVGQHMLARGLGMQDLHQPLSHGRRAATPSGR
jgi:DNA-binding GntR family transcriptional regulator